MSYFGKIIKRQHFELSPYRRIRNVTDSSMSYFGKIIKRQHFALVVSRIRVLDTAEVRTSDLWQ